MIVLIGRAPLFQDLDRRLARRDVGQEAQHGRAKVFEIVIDRRMGHEPVVLVVRTLEDRLQAVVVALGNGVVFVSVAARALDGEPHNSRA